MWRRFESEKKTVSDTKHQKCTRADHRVYESERILMEIHAISALDCGEEVISCCWTGSHEHLHFPCIMYADFYCASAFTAEMGWCSWGRDFLLERTRSRSRAGHANCAS